MAFDSAVFIEPEDRWTLTLTPELILSQREANRAS